MRPEHYCWAYFENQDAPVKLHPRGGGPACELGPQRDRPRQQEGTQPKGSKVEVEIISREALSAGLVLDMFE